MHDGTWVAHPDLVGLAMIVFDKYMPTKKSDSYKQRTLMLLEETIRSTSWDNNEEGS
jgi:malate synthase